MSGNIILLKRVYDPPVPLDGYRILVERLWPRGVKKEAARIDLWAKEVAPSTELRQWFGHDPERWVEFRRRYFAELDENPAALEVMARVRDGAVTFVYSSREQRFNNAVALKDYIEKQT